MLRRHSLYGRSHIALKLDGEGALLLCQVGRELACGSGHGLCSGFVVVVVVVVGGGVGATEESTVVALLLYLAVGTVGSCRAQCSYALVTTTAQPDRDDEASSSSSSHNPRITQPIGQSIINQPTMQSRKLNGLAVHGSSKHLVTSVCATSDLIISSMCLPMRLLTSSSCCALRPAI